MNYKLKENKSSPPKLNPNILMNFTKKNHAKTVIKRDGRIVPIEFDKITERIRALSTDLPGVNPAFVTQDIVPSIPDCMHVRQIDELAAETAASMTAIHPDYNILAGRIVVSNLHKETPSNFSEAMEIIHNSDQPKFEEVNYVDEKVDSKVHSLVKELRIFNPEKVDELFNHRKLKYFDENFMVCVLKHKKVLDAAINHGADYTYGYFSMMTLMNSYLNKIDHPDYKHGKIIERPQYMLMRVSLFINQNSIPDTLQTYKILSEKYYTHATPTLFNAGSRVAQLSSCFLVSLKDDSIDGIYETLKNCALISKNAGGLGINFHNIRAKGSLIRSCNRHSEGIVPALKNYESSALYCDQGRRRKGAYAIYLEPWHADIEEFIQLRTNRGDEFRKTRDLFIALWVPDLFMERVSEDKEWTLFSPDTAPGLNKVYGDDFKKLYTLYESLGLGFKTIEARTLWKSIIDVQIETGTPYILYKDACNRKSNQKNLGTIQSSNLCCEIIEYTAPDEIAVCNLASLSLPSFILDKKNKIYDFDKLHQITRTVTRNLDKIIDCNYYPVPEAKKSNMRHRPVGIGVQGLADVFCMFKYAFDSKESRELNKNIFETIYHAALVESNSLAKNVGKYETFEGSPASHGILQFDMWGVEPSERYDWDHLKEEIKIHGLRNSLLVAPMPTASTAQILGNYESFEPLTSNFYVRTVASGDFIVYNSHLTQDMIELGIWDEDHVNNLILNDGSVKNMPDLPDHLKEVYKTVYEIKVKPLIDMAADRGAYICQSQSFNVHVKKPTYPVMNSIHFYAWKSGLKTGMYYLRSSSTTEAVKFTLDPTLERKGSKITGRKNKKNKKKEQKGNLQTNPNQTNNLNKQNKQNKPNQKPKVYLCDDHSCCSG